MTIPYLNQGEYELSVIVPVRLIESRLDILERIEFCCEARNSKVEFLIVDDGSEQAYADSIQNKCFELGIRYLSTQADPESQFNLARARNFGALHAKGQLLLIMDVDLVPYPTFYDDILIEAEMLDMKNTVDHLLMCPVIYLTDSGYQQYKNTALAHRKSFCINQMLSSNKDNVEKYSHGTSVVVVNRYFYLSCGGQNENFEGWGYEDYEFNTRLIRKNMRYPLPRKWSSMKGNFMNIKKYKGWKSIYRLYGDWLGAKGIYLVHVPHQISSEYHANKKRNEKLLKRQLNRDFDMLEPAPLVWGQQKTAVLEASVYTASRYLANVFGELVKFSAVPLETFADISRWVEENHITQFAFKLPLHDVKSELVYQWCKQNDFDFFMLGRGALPNSIFINKNDQWDIRRPLSESLWNKELNGSDLADVTRYLLSNEKKRQRRLAKLKAEPFASSGKKVLLISNIESGSLSAKSRALKAINYLVNNLNEGWVILYPKSDFNIRSNRERLFALQDKDIFEAEELADAIVAFNSYSALHGAICGKAVYLLSTSWFAHKQLNVLATSHQDLLSKVQEGFSPNREMVLRFVNYLRFKCYSFAFTLEQPGSSEAHVIERVTSLKFYELRGFSESTIYFNRGRDIIPFNSPQFDRYWSDRYQKLSRFRTVIYNKASLNALVQGMKKIFFKPGIRYNNTNYK
ncbi:glycosyltransferase [Thalassotalea mangrovi]|uniref:Glycosyltransferase n=1 Tax=Thalassotalea mangrovi TaxID=2572245 RepID=A0A4U1B6M2_9GAMM|nr:glycosyltransferase [Thalassotalea mangrovi]TKB46100.1 glycosyltransferase [Thalassotalea mangrovi]